MKKYLSIFIAFFVITVVTSCDCATGKNNSTVSTEKIIEHQNVPYSQENMDETVATCTYYQDQNSSIIYAVFRHNDGNGSRVIIVPLSDQQIDLVRGGNSNIQKFYSK